MELEAPKKNSKLIICIFGILIVIAAISIVFSLSQGGTSKAIKEKLELADRYMTELKYDEAIALYKEMLEIEPKSVEAYKGLFEAYIATGDEAKAQEILDKAKGIMTADEMAGMQSAFAEKFGGDKDSQNAEENEEEGTDSFVSWGKCTKELYFNVDGSSNGWREYDYDSAGNITKECLFDSDGTISYGDEFEYGDSGDVTRKTHYGRGWEKSYTYEYDSRGNEIHKINYLEDGSIYEVKCTYNSSDKLIKEIDYKGGAFYAGYEYEYDSKGRKICLYYLIGETTRDPNKKMEIVYDLDGLHSQRLYTTNDKTYVTGDEWYDELGREIKSISYELNGSISFTAEDSYDEAGHNTRRITTYADGSKGWYIYEYNANGDIVRHASLYEGEAYKYFAGYSDTVYEYDSYGNCIKSTEYDKNGNLLGYADLKYDHNGNEIRVENYDAEGNLVSWVDYEYNPD